MTDAAFDRWTNLDQLRGFQKLHLDELSQAQREAVLARHPDNCMYFEDVPMSKGEHDEYDRLNQLLHKKIRDAARRFFHGVPLPVEYAARRKDPAFHLETGTAFTSQNWDWYGPTYEVYVTVLERYISSSLLRALQGLLDDDHCDWCIVVCTCEDVDFDALYDFLVFSDQVLIQHGVAKLMGIP